MSCDVHFPIGGCLFRCFTQLNVSGGRTFPQGKDFSFKSGERRVGEEWRSRGSPYHYKKKKNVTWLSHMLDFQLLGLRPAGHHLSSLFLHTLNLVFFKLKTAYEITR